MIYKFQEIGKLPVNVWVDKLECGKTFGGSLFQNKAKYHKSCKLKFGKTKLEKAIKAVNAAEMGEVNMEQSRGIIIYFLSLIRIFNSK